MAVGNGAMLGAAAPGTFENLLDTIRIYLSGFTNMTYSSDSFTAANIGVENVMRFRAYIQAVLPELFVIIGVIIAIRVALKLFKKFSR